MGGKNHQLEHVKHWNRALERNTTIITRWWFQIFFMFIPIWGRFPNWLIFFVWVETTVFCWGRKPTTLPGGSPSTWTPVEPETAAYVTPVELGIPSRNGIATTSTPHTVSDLQFGDGSCCPAMNSHFGTTGGPGNEIKEEYSGTRKVGENGTW